MVRLNNQTTFPELVEAIQHTFLYHEIKCEASKTHWKWTEKAAQQALQNQVDALLVAQPTTKPNEAELGVLKRHSFCPNDFHLKQTWGYAILGTILNMMYKWTSISAQCLFNFDFKIKNSETTSALELHSSKSQISKPRSIETWCLMSPRAVLCYNWT